MSNAFSLVTASYGLKPFADGRYGRNGTSPFLVRYFLLFLLFALPAVLFPAAAQTAALPVQLETRVVAEETAQGRTPLIVLWVTPAAGYYAYAHTETHGRPLDVRVATGGVVRAEELYPVPITRPDLFEPDVRIAAHEGRFPLFVRLTAPRDALFPSSVDITLSMLLCSATRCVPIDERLTVLLPELRLLPPLSQFPALVRALAESQAGSSVQTQNQPASPERPGAPALVPSHVAGWDFAPRYAQQGLEPDALWLALLLGMPAGLLLNVMPCVLPVLTLKLTGLLGAAAGQGVPRTRRRVFRQHNLYFATGILVWFACLAAAFAGAGALWGELFRSQGLVIGLMLLIFLMALSLFGVFPLPLPGLTLAPSAQAHPRGEAFVSGLLVTLLATPCSGPLLGGVLGWAAMQPVAAQGMVFAAVGLGMALPYLALALFPDTVRFFPKPGPWLGIVAKIAGVFLLGTVLYLLLILPRAQWVAAGLCLGVAAVAAWIWGRWAGLSAPFGRRVLIGLAGLTVICAAAALTVRIPPAAQEKLAFSVSTFREALGQRNLLVQFTADWCPSCKVLERTTLSPDTLRPLLAKYKLTFMRVDLTRPQPEADALLRALGSVSIPVAAIFPAADARRPLVVRDLFTPDQLRRALREALETPAP